MKNVVSRQRAIVVAATAVLGSGIRPPAGAAEFTYKFAHNQPIGSLLYVWTTQLWNQVEKETNGRLKVEIFPNSILGGETDMLSQLRLGAIQLFALTGVSLSGAVPATGIESVPFVFKNAKQAYDAMDGALGSYIRGEIAAKGIHAFDRNMGYGFYQLSNSVKPIRSADDMNGLKFRSAAARISVDTFKSLGASATPMNIVETYTALQTHVVDGQTNPYATIETTKFYEVQKYVSEVNMTFAFPYTMANQKAWDALPLDIQNVVIRNQAKYALLERRAEVVAAVAAQDKLTRQGMIMNVAPQTSFRDKLVAAGFYGRWKDEFGAKAWSLLEQYVGKTG